MTQYEDYGSIPQAVRDLVANKVSLLDQYILMETRDREYTALIRNTSTDETRQVVCYYVDGVYQVYEAEGEWDWEVTNEYYVYSNVGYGAALDLPVVHGVTAHSTIIMCCALMFAIVFKGVLFPCLLGRKRKGF